MIKGTFWKPLAWWAYSAVAVTGMLVVAYALVQQDYRTSLDDPQIQMAEDGALALAHGGEPADVVPHSALFDAEASLSPWIAVFDKNGTPLESSATMGAEALQLPKGLFDTSTWSKAPMFVQNGMRESRFTWQPNAATRQAVVLVQTTDGRFVASGRNMRDVEQRIEHEGEMAFVGWVVILAGLFVASFITWRLLTNKKDIV